MSERRFTAREMCEVAEGLVDSCVADNISILVGHGNLKVVKGDRIVAMLRYAADVVERCEAELALTDENHYTYSRLNYILRGDAGKEEK